MSLKSQARFLLATLQASHHPYLMGKAGLDLGWRDPSDLPLTLQQTTAPQPKNLKQ